jgi:hypothetical protein
MTGWQVNDNGEQTRPNIHALNRIRTHGLRVQAIKAWAADRAATGTDMENVIIVVWILVIKVENILQIQ